MGVVFVEKVLREQPNVRKLFLLVRATDTKTAARRLQKEVSTHLHSCECDHITPAIWLKNIHVHLSPTIE